MSQSLSDYHRETKETAFLMTVQAAGAAAFATEYFLKSLEELNPIHQVRLFDGTRLIAGHRLAFFDGAAENRNRLTRTLSA